MSKHNNVVYINHQIREKGKKINIFDKVNQIKSDLKSLLPEIEDDRILPMFSHIRNFFYGKLHYGRRSIPENLGRKRELTESEKIV